MAILTGSEAHVFAGVLNGVLEKPRTERFADFYQSPNPQPEPRPRRAMDFWQDLSLSSSIADLARKVQKSNLPDADKQLVTFMARDFFKNSPDARISAFTKGSVGEILRIIRRGVINFQRAEGHSDDRSEGAYDIVGYRIVQRDQSTSYLVAYRDGSAGKSKADLRPRINLLLTEADPDHMRKVVVGDHRRAEQGSEARTQAEQQIVNLIKF